MEAVVKQVELFLIYLVAAEAHSLRPNNLAADAI